MNTPTQPAPCVYVVFGAFAEDWAQDYTWTVAAYPDKADAEKHAHAANAAVKDCNEWTYEARDKFKNPFDAKCRIDACGQTTYSVESVPFFLSFSPSV